ncbi:MAG: tryptophan--tRNA ligase [Elusimicrobiota bacterium]
MEKQEIVVSGMRPTGRLHLGNYWGALMKWVELANQYPGRCYFFVADWHMLTTGYEDTSKLRENTREMVSDWFAAGLDPKKCVIFRQSDVPEHAELALILGMVTPVSLLENNPTWKEHLQEVAKTECPEFGGRIGDQISGGIKANIKKTLERTFGFLGYPVLQAADVLIYHGAKVPVGKDQLPHVELSREIARRFNNIFGRVLTEPQPLLTSTPKVPGTDGRKMSKSYDNAINLYETADSLKRKVMRAYTDPNRVKAADPGHPEPCPENPPGCPIFALHKLYADEAFIKRRDSECRAGQVGCVACKRDLLANLDPEFARLRQSRERYAVDPEFIENILRDGAVQARVAAHETMVEVRKAVKIA